MTAESNHLLLATVDSSALPNWFEIQILERIDAVLQPSLDYVSSSAAGSRDSRVRMSAMISWLIVQFNCIERTGSSVAELFLGIRRVAYAGDQSPPREMSLVQRRLSFALLTMAPKVVAHLMVFLNRRHAARGTTISPSMTILQRMGHTMTWAIYRSLPMLQSAYSMASTSQQIAYMFGATRHYSPVMALLDIHYEKVRGRSSTATSPSASTPTPAVTASNSGSNQYRGVDMNTILIGLLLCVKAVDFLTRNAHNFTGDAEGVGIRGSDGGVYTPSIPDNSSSSTASQRDGKCPLCKQSPSGPCAAPSGNVFCYTCLRDSIENNGGLCPVSGLDCSFDDIIQIFAEEHEV
jgi:hypothetical protein